MPRSDPSSAPQKPTTPRCLRCSGSCSPPDYPSSHSPRWGEQLRDACVLCRDPLLCRAKLHTQRQDQRILLGVAQLAEVSGRDHPPFRIEAPATVSSIIRCGRSNRSPSTRSHAELRLPHVRCYGAGGEGDGTIVAATDG